MSKALVTRIRRLIGKITDEQEAKSVRNYASDRADLIRKKEEERLDKEAWDIIESLPTGTLCFIRDGRSGLRNGCIYARGQVQPRAKRMWMMPHDPGLSYLKPVHLPVKGFRYNDIVPLSSSELRRAAQLTRLREGAGI